MAASKLKSYICRRIPKGTRIKIDGKLDEKVWAKLKSVGPFEFPWAKKGDLKQSTVAKLCWDDEYLYLGYHANDLSINAKKRGPKGKVWLDDVVEIFIDPTPKDKIYYGFELNANGDLLDYEMEYYRKNNFKWCSPNSKTAIHVVKDRYFQGEFKISFKDLGFYPKLGSKWKMCLCRCDYNKGRRDEFMLWQKNKSKRPDFHLFSGFGNLIFSK